MANVLLNSKKFKEYISSKKKSLTHFSESFSSQMAKEIHDRIVDNAKKHDATYADDILLTRIDDNEYVIRVEEKTTVISKLDMAVFNYKSMNKNLISSPILAILSGNGPYHKSCLPLSPGKDFGIFFRKISPKEYANIFSEENLTHFISSVFPIIKKALLGLQVPSSRILDPNKIDINTLVYEDIAFNTIRKEFGLRANKVPIWLPVIEDFRDGTILKDVLNGYKEGEKIDLPHESTSVLDGNTKFQEVILKR